MDSVGQTLSQKSKTSQEGTAKPILKKKRINKSLKLGTSNTPRTQGLQDFSQKKRHFMRHPERPLEPPNLHFNHLRVHVSAHPGGGGGAQKLKTERVLRC